MTDTLAPVEHTNWALSAWNSTLDRNDVPSAWLYGQDHLWATSHLVSLPGEVLYISTYVGYISDREFQSKLFNAKLKLNISSHIIKG